MYMYFYVYMYIANDASLSNLYPFHHNKQPVRLSVRSQWRQFHIGNVS